MMMKECAKCRNSFEATTEFFYKLKSAKDGLHNKCKGCYKSDQKKWNDKNIERRANNDRKRYERDKERINDRNNNWKRKNKSQQAEYLKGYQKTDVGKLKFKTYSINRRTKRNLLPSTMTDDDYKDLLEMFDNKCSLTNSTDIAIDHFVPLSWGHGGTYIGNLLPMDSVLNSKKKNKNPIKFLISLVKSGTITTGIYDLILLYFANKNNVSVVEFIDFVYWCDRNRRKLAEIEKSKGKMSIDIWKDKQ